MENEKQPTTRLRLKEDELDLVLKYRRIKEESIAAGINPDDVKHGWLKTEKASLFFKNPNFKTEEKNEFAKNLIEELKQYSPIYPTIKRTKSSDGHLLIIDIADLHINKYAEAYLTGADYNSKIAVERALEGTKGLIKKASGFDIEKVVFIISVLMPCIAISFSLQIAPPFPAVDPYLNELSETVKFPSNKSILAS